MDKEILPKPENWDVVMLRMAAVIATMSKDPATKVGAVLVSPDRTRISVGYNGFPKQIPDRVEWWNNRNPESPTFSKYELVRHAEMNAITQAKTDLNGWTLYVTHHPCIDCAKNIVAEGIKRVVYSGKADGTTMAINHEKIVNLFEIARIMFENIIISSKDLK